MNKKILYIILGLAVIIAIAIGSFYMAFTMYKTRPNIIVAEDTSVADTSKKSYSEKNNAENNANFPTSNELIEYVKLSIKNKDKNGFLLAFNPLYLEKNKVIINDWFSSDKKLNDINNALETIKPYNTGGSNPDEYIFEINNKKGMILAVNIQEGAPGEANSQNHDSWKIFLISDDFEKTTKEFGDRISATRIYSNNPAEALMGCADALAANDVKKALRYIIFDMNDVYKEEEYTLLFSNQSIRNDLAQSLKNSTADSIGDEFAEFNAISKQADGTNIGSSVQLIKTPSGWSISSL